MRRRHQRILIHLIPVLCLAAWLVCCSLRWQDVEYATWPRTPFGGRPQHIDLLINPEASLIYDDVYPDDLKNLNTKERMAAIELALNHQEEATGLAIRWAILLIGGVLLYFLAYVGAVLAMGAYRRIARRKISTR